MVGKRKIYDESMRIAVNFSWDKDWTNAVKAYRASLQESPDDPEALIGIATAYFELEQYESAIRALQRTLKNNPTNHKALSKMGDVFERLGQLEEAARTYVYTGNLFAKAGELPQAIEAWEKAIRAHPDQIQARNNLAHAYTRQNQPEQAIAELIALAAIYQHNNDLARAEQYLQGALKLAPDHTYTRAALIALQTGQSIRAVQQDMAKITYSQQPNAPADEVLLPEEDLLAFTDLEDRDAIKTPTNPRRQVEEMALQLLAGILFEDNFEFDTISISKSQLALLIGQAIDWQTRGDTTQALTTYQKILASGFKHPAVIFVIATLLLKQGDYNQAITSFNQAKTERNYLQGINFGLGECYKAQKDINQALRHFVEVLKVIDLRNVHNEGTEELNQLYHDLVNNYITTADEKKSTQFVESLIKFLSSPNYEQKISEARRRLGTGDSTSVSAWIEFLEAPNTEIILSAMTSTGEYMRQNMLMTAVETCYRAIQQAPFYLPLHLRLAEIYMKQEAIENSIKKYLAVAEVYYVRGNFKQVTGIYQKVLKVAPMDVTVRSKLVDLYINQNNYEAALEQNQILADAYYQIAQIDRALETYQASLNVAAKSANPVRWQVDILHHLGDIYAQRVDWGNAAKIYGQLVTLSPEDEKAMLALVDLYFKLGRGSQALQILDRTIGLFIKHNKQARIIEFLKDMTQLRPHELPLHDKLAALYGHLGMRLEAIAQYNIMADMQLEAGLRDDAARTIQRIIDLNPNDVSKYRQLLAQIKGGI